jgi:hypothetical protein
MMPKVSDEAVAAYDAVAAGLEGAGVVRGSMFGMPCLKIGKKVLAGMYDQSGVWPDYAAEALEYVAR